MTSFLLFLACAGKTEPQTCTVVHDEKLLFQAEVYRCDANVLSIVNNGNEGMQCEILGVFQDCAESPFQLNPGSFTVPPGGGVEMEVDYCPTVVLGCAANVLLSCSAAQSICQDIHGQSEFSIQLVGVATGTDRDGDGYFYPDSDCNDGDALVHPGAAEVENGVDDDCDGVADDGTSLCDDDGDGFTEVDGDCDDLHAERFPGAIEKVNGEDDDCDGRDDDETDVYDDDGDGFSEVQGDCDDGNPLLFPGNPEVCDGLDQDCDGNADEGTSCYDDDGDGQTEDEGDCDDANVMRSLGQGEVEDGIDNDCDGTIDEGTDAFDDDGDGYSENAGDCNDTNASIHPGQPESPPYPDLIDDNCNLSLTW